jgi:hypothetical protein
LGTREPSCIARPASPFFMLEARCPQKVMRHMTVLEPTLAGKQGPEPQDMWQRQSPPQQRGEIRGHETCGGARSHLGREVGSEATGHVVVLEPL